MKHGDFCGSQGSIMKCFFLIGIVFASVLQIQAAVNVTLYYESLCQDTITFFKHQLWPTYQALGDDLKIEFIPFGKAWWIENPWFIMCQHGPAECYGNAIQACALEKYKKPKEQVKFISCVMLEKQPNNAGPTCSKQLGYSFEGIEKCAVGDEGMKLLKKYGRRTKDFKPTIDFIPTVAFNNIYNDQDQQWSLNQFKNVVCKKFPTEEKPPGCN